MKMLTVLPRIIAVGMIFLMPATAQQSKDKANVTAGQKSPEPKPGPEMDQLKFLRGYWHYVSTYDKSSFYPYGGKGSGTHITTEGPGGFSQIAEFQGTSPDGFQAGHEVTTWDPQELAYKSYVFGNNFPACVVRTGHWDGNNLIFDADFELGGAKLHMQSSTTANPDGTVTIVERFSADGAPMQTLLTLKATHEKI
jgi:hypothetical protein